MALTTTTIASGFGYLEAPRRHRGRPAHFKTPKPIEIRAESPRTSTGEPAKAELRAELRASSG